MENSWKSFILLFGLLLASACSPPLSEAEMTATQEALYSPTPTVTNTSTPTLTPTVTRTPTATPVQFEVENQENGSTLVRNFVYRIQFELPSGWTYSPPRPGSEGLGSAGFNNGAGSSVRLTVSSEDTSRSTEEFTDDRIFMYRDLFGLVIHRQGSTTSQSGVPLAYLEASGEYNSGQVHYYLIILRSRGVLIHFDFSGDINAARTAIGQIQASIQRTPYTTP